MKRILGVLGACLLSLIAVILVRTARFASRQVEVQSAAPVSLDAQVVAARLARALQFQTVSLQDTAPVNHDAFMGVHRYLQEQFPLVHGRLRREVIGDYSLLYTWQGTDPARKPVVLLAHLDVVPVEPGTEQAWRFPPFAGEIAEGFVWGRGALDDKFAVLATLEAVETLLRDGFQPAVTVYLAFGHDEEIGGGRGARRMAEVLHDRGAAAEYVLDEGGALTRGMFPGVTTPVAVIGIAEKGSVSLELSVHSEGGHSSAPPPHTAVGLISTAVHNVEAHPMPPALQGAARRFVDYVGPELPFVYRAVLANLWLFGGLVERQMAASPAANASLRTTTAATMIEGGVKENVLPSAAHAVINFRILPGDSVQGVVDHVRRAVDDPRIDVRELHPGREPSAESPIDVPAFTLLQRTIRQVFPGTIVAPYLTIAGTDSRHYAAVTPNVYRFAPLVGDPSDLARIHGTNERISIENYARAVQFYIQLLRNSGAAH